MEAGLIVSASGIRGVAGDALNPQVAARYGAAYGTLLREKGGGGGRVLVARDSRTTGPALVDAVAAGLRGAGCRVGDAGLAPTPTALLAVQDDPGAVGGVIVTASHNPAEWNGLKLAGPEGEFVSPEEGREVQRIFESGPRWAGWDGFGAREPVPDVGDHHVERILSLPLVSGEDIAAAGFTVALDTVRGAAGPVLSSLLERLGCRVEGLDLEPDGRFPRDPEPRPENLAGLADRVRETGADLGMAADPDGDRLALVDGGGRPVGEDLTLALAVGYVLRHRPGPVVTNLSTSRVVADVAERAGQAVHLAPVGEANVARRMREVEAVVGGEGNGGVMLPALHLTRDAPLAATLVLALLAGEGASLEEMVAEFPRYHIVKGKFPRDGDGMETAYSALEEQLSAPSVDRQDGLRLDWPEERRWVHVRPSGTEPVVRILAEAPREEEARDLAERAREVLAARG